MKSAVRGIRINEAVLYADLRSERPHAFDMLIDRPNAEVAAARHRGLSTAETSQHGPDQIVGGTNLTHQVIRGVLIACIGTVDFNCTLIQITDPGPQLSQNCKQGICIADLRDILNPAHALNQKRRRDNRDCCIFCTADFNFAVQRSSAADDILIHGTPSHLLWRCQGNAGEIYYHRIAQLASKFIECLKKAHCQYITEPSLFPYETSKKIADF